MQDFARNCYAIGWNESTDLSFITILHSSKNITFTKKILGLGYTKTCGWYQMSLEIFLMLPIG